MAPRISQQPVAASPAASPSKHASFVAKGTFAPKEVWGVFCPIRSLELDGEQFVAELRTGECLRGQFEFNEGSAQDTLLLASAVGKKLVFNVNDFTLGRHNELTSVTLSDAAAKAPPFSLFLKRA